MHLALVHNPRFIYSRKEWSSTIMFRSQNNKLRTLWLALSVIIAVVALFGAMHWVPVSGNSTGLLWAILALMVAQSYALYKEGKQS